MTTERGSDPEMGISGPGDGLLEAWSDHDKPLPLRVQDDPVCRLSGLQHIRIAIARLVGELEGA
jgi:hypothetical protein